MWRFGSPAKELTQPSSHLVWSPGPLAAARCLSLLYTRRQLGGQTFLTKLAARRQHQSARRPRTHRPTQPPFLCLSDSFFTFELRAPEFLSPCLSNENSHSSEVPRFFAALETVLLGWAKYLTLLCCRVCVSDAAAAFQKSCVCVYLCAQGQRWKLERAKITVILIFLGFWCYHCF